MAARLFVIESDVVIDELRKRCAPDGGAIDCAALRVVRRVIHRELRRHHVEAARHPGASPM